MVLVFDLDDTLFDETTYVKSGFEAVAHYLSSKNNFEFNSVLEVMDSILSRKGRGHVFDDTLNYFKIYSKKEVLKCLSVYRMHEPKIKLWKAAEKCLIRFKNHPIYIVTDGNKIVQHKKIVALGLENKVKKYFISYRHGLKHSKPSPYCFLKIAQLEKSNPDKIIYIGDNVNKDFVGIKPLGFKTIRVLTGQHSEISKAKEFEADYTINSLDELTPQLLNKIYGS